ncbi:MAG: BlaI/MecI/CopY family transcriptional regulator [Myxococcota bacterium]
MTEKTPKRPALSRREREILDIVYRLGRATAAQVRAELVDSPSDSSVRTLLRLMEEKGHLAHESDGPRYVYFATTPPEVAGRRALRHLVHTFFGGSVDQLVSTLIDDDEIDDDALDALTKLVEDKRRDTP